ncbi:MULTISPECIES: cell division protein FtsL [Limnobacter]|uniref:Cell division protein FtsL n=1 Tax=Limnobacter litoralis TaxID=481366 RepID=A0ABQ5YNA0_9BURK|nr:MULTISPECIES: cell division protein FtsL [Limnobacter]GLR26063.1 cell division protein FtsL [Limnobacter litoralis]HEX5485769.1 cell division protein FtsL [Limnobacter sp.]
MGRLNILLLLLVVGCAIRLVDAQHTARTLFVELGRERQVERQLEVAYTRLQVEQTSLSKGERVVELAKSKLKMVYPAPNDVVFMNLDSGGGHE